MRACFGPRLLVNVIAANSARLRCYGVASGSAGKAVTSKPAPDVISIASTANTLVKQCSKLRTSRGYREETGTFLLCGQELLAEAAAGVGGVLKAECALVLQQPSDGGQEVQTPKWLSAGRVAAVTENVMRKVAGVENAGSIRVAAVLRRPANVDLLSWGAHEATGGKHVPLQRVLCLDAVQDPGNLGTLIRSALAFGFDALCLLPGCCDPFNEKAVRASQGAVFRLPLACCSLEELQAAAQKHKLVLVAAEPDAEAGKAAAAQQVSGAPQGVVLVLGSEGSGLSPAVLQSCTPVSIPMAGDMESLNVAVAGSILMFALSQGGLKALLQQLNSIGLVPQHADA